MLGTAATKENICSLQAVFRMFVRFTASKYF